MTKMSGLDVLTVAGFERIVKDHPEEIEQAMTVADKLRATLARPSQADVEPALIYQMRGDRM
jgi:hypothetical protein